MKKLLKFSVTASYSSFDRDHLQLDRCDCSLHAFHWLMQWFRTFMLANLLFEPIIQIDSIDDLHKVVKLFHSRDHNFTVVAYKEHLAWHLLKTSQETNFRNVFKLLTNDKQFGYQHIYEGKRVTIGFSGIFEYVIKVNPHMHLHLSRANSTSCQT